MSLQLYLITLLISGVLSASIHNVKTPTPVSVTLYYETLCPDCQSFIPEKLFSTYTDKKFDFASLFANLTLVPYGFAEVIDQSKHQFQCQHGNSECEGNRFHECAIKYITDTKTMLTYISCLEKNSYVSDSNEYPIDKCKDEIPEGIYSSILNCYNSEEGWNLFNEYGNKTNSFFGDAEFAFVPYISFNNEKNDKVAMNAVDDFRKTLCSVTGVVDAKCSDNSV